MKIYHFRTGYVVIMNKIPEHAQAQVMRALMAAYRKHAMGDDSIGWNELSGKIFTALQESMGEDGFSMWRDSVRLTK